MRSRVTAILLVIVCFSVASFSSEPVSRSKAIIFHKNGAQPSDDFLSEIGASRIHTYETYTLVSIPGASRAAVEQQLSAASWRAEVHDDWDIIQMPRRAVDARSTDIGVDGYADGFGLYVLKFIGPLLPDWHEAVRGAGLKILGYLPHHALLVFGTNDAFNQARALNVIEWSTMYDPSLRATVPQSEAVAAYTVAFVDTPAAERSVFRLHEQSRATTNMQYGPSMQLWQATISGTEAASWVNDPFCVYVERRGEWKSSGEVESLSLTDVGYYYYPFFGGNYYRNWLQTYGVLDTQNYTIAIADTGFSNGQGQPVHQDFPADAYPTPKVRWKSYVSGEAVYGQDEDGHGTAVAGLALGDSPSGMLSGFWTGLGVAPKTRLYAQRIFGSSSGPHQSIYTWLNDANTLGAASVMNLSRNEYTIGAHGMYTSSDFAADRAVRNQSLPVTVSAGNIYPNRAPFELDSQTGYQVLSPGVAKNVITVGSVDSYRPNYPCAAETLTRVPSEWNSGAGYFTIPYFSRRGTNDGRYKPDILAPGGQASSAYTPRVDPSQRVWCWNNGTHLVSSGTSFSAPQAAGALVLVNKKRGITAPMTPALAKATLVGLAQSVKNGDHRYPTSQPYSVAARPDPNGQGWGKLMIGDFITGATKGVFVDSVPYNGTGQWNQAFRYSGDGYPARQSPSFYVCNSSKPVHIVLAWTDYPGLPPIPTGYTLNNDLFLKVQVNSCATGDAYQGNRFNGTTEESLNMCAFGSPGVDYRNNVEVVTVPAGTAQSVSLNVEAIQVNMLGDPSCTAAGAAAGSCDKYLHQGWSVFISNASTSPCY